MQAVGHNQDSIALKIKIGLVTTIYIIDYSYSTVGTQYLLPLITQAQRKEHAIVVVRFGTFTVCWASALVLVYRCCLDAKTMSFRVCCLHVVGQFDVNGQCTVVCRIILQYPVSDIYKVLCSYDMISWWDHLRFHVLYLFTVKLFMETVARIPRWILTALLLLSHLGTVQAGTSRSITRSSWKQRHSETIMWCFVKIVSLSYHR